MVVSTTEYGNYTVHTGTLAEVMAAVQAAAPAKETLQVGGTTAAGWAVY